MNIKQTLTEQMRTALRSGDKETLSTIRMLVSEINNFEIDNGDQDDAGVQKLVVKSIKQWQDALGDYEKAQRADLIKEAKDRIEFLKKFLPEQLGEDEIKKVIDEVIASLPEPSVGPVIGKVMKKLAGKADGGTVARLVNEALAK
jgi:hypothetical protein